MKNRAGRWGALLMVAAALACADPDWEEQREPVDGLGAGGAVADVAEELRADGDPRRIIYAPPPDLTLRDSAAAATDSAAARADTAATPADTARTGGAAADTSGARAARDTIGG